MPRLRTLIVRIFSAFSLLLALAAATNWLRTYRHPESMNCSTSPTTIWLYISSHGGIQIGHYTYTYPDAPARALHGFKDVFQPHYSKDMPSPSNLAYPLINRTSPTLLNRIGFEFNADTYPHDHGGTVHRLITTLPYWFLTLLLLLLPTLHFLSFSGRGGRSGRWGRDFGCGGVFGGSPGQTCPECGKPIPQ